MDMEWFDRVIVARDRKINDLEATLKTERALMESQLAALTAERDAARAQLASMTLDRNLLAAENALKKTAIDELADMVDALRRQLADSRLWCTMCGDQLDATSVCATCYDLRPCEACDDMARQLAAAQEWQPVSDGEYGTIHVEENGEWIAINDRDSDGLKSYLGTTPPDDLRLCRRTRQEPPA